MLFIIKKCLQLYWHYKNSDSICQMLSIKLKFKQTIKIYLILKLFKILIKNKLKNYNLKIILKAGKKIKKADILSKQTDYEKKKNNNKNVTLLKLKQFI